MTASSDQAGLTARTLLLGTGNETAELARALSEHDALGKSRADLTRLTPEGRQAASEAIASVAVGMLELDLGNMLISAWRAHELLLTAAKETVKKPGSEQVVQLASHKVTWTYQPKVDLVIDEVRAHTFQFQLTAEFDIEVAAAIIRDGKLVGLRSGDATVSAALSIAAPGEDTGLIRQERQLDLHLIIHLGDGIPLLSTDSGIPGSHPAALS